jgi:hypothetical protein
MTEKKMPKALSDYFRAMGKKGGKRALKTMTPEERSARAKKAAAASAKVRAKKAAAKRKQKG